MKSFRSRLLLAVIALIVLVQGATVFAVLERTRTEMASGAAAHLEANVDAFARMNMTRNHLLQIAVENIAREQSFNAALVNAGADRQLLQDVLRASSSHIRAQGLFLLNGDGDLLATTASRIDAQSAPELAEVVGSLATDKSHSFLAVVGGTALHVALAPAVVQGLPAWLGAIIELDDAAAHQFGRFIDLQVSIIARDPDGRRFAISTLPKQLRPVLYALTPAPASTPRTAQIVELGGQQYLTEFLPLKAQRGDIYAILQQPMDELSARYERLRLEMLLISGSAVLVAAIIVALLSRRALRPIDQLVSAAQRIEQGRYNERVVVSGGAEFERLASVFEGMQRRIAERESRIVYQARHDSLTGLPNRQAARARLQRLLKTGVPVGLVLLDLRGFKHLNASFGHELGNQILKEIARRLTSAVRAGDSVARLGADQYLLILRGNGVDHAAAIAAQVVRDVRQGMLLGSIEISLDVHAGVCAAPEHGATSEDLMRRADIALQAAKSDGVPIRRYEPGHDEVYRKRLKLLVDLRTAITTNQLNLVFQPKVQMADRRVQSLEALVRWTHPELGTIPPGEFVPLAEQTGAIGDLTRWVLRTAIEQLARWRVTGFETEVAVNLSASDLNDPELPDEILSLLTSHDVLPRQIMLEITESAVMREPERAIRVMRRLRDAGLRFSIDDFGTGHSSLAQLRALPVDEIKIDRSFIRDLEQGTRDDAIVRSTIDLGHSLGLKVVAEGVETPAAWTALLRLGCDFAQGYFVSRPLPVDQVDAWIKEFNAQLAGAETGTAQVRVLTELRSTRR